MTAAFFSKDIVEFLFLLNKYKVDYLIVGGEAVIYYGHARLTGDIDIFYGRGKENCNRLFQSLKEFWNDDIPGIKNHRELQKKGAIFQFGVPPNRIDLINLIEKVDFSTAFNNRVFEKINYKYISREDKFQIIVDKLLNKELDKEFGKRKR